MRSADGLRRVKREEMKLIDTMATSAFGIPSIVLMESAGRQVAEAALELLGGKAAGAVVLVFASPGHNGGDGCVAARYLANAGALPRVLLVGRDPGTVTTDTAANLKVLKRMGVKVDEARTPAQLQSLLLGQPAPALVIDALLGTGFSSISGEVREPLASAIDTINTLGVPVVSADIPSGLDGNTGKGIGRAVKATWTVTFGLPKVGFFVPGAEAYLGRLTVADLGLPTALLEGKPAAPAASPEGKRHA